MDHIDNVEQLCSVILGEADAWNRAHGIFQINDHHILTQMNAVAEEGRVSLQISCEVNDAHPYGASRNHFVYSRCLFELERWIDPGVSAGYQLEHIRDFVSMTLSGCYSRIFSAVLNGNVMWLEDFRG